MPINSGPVTGGSSGGGGDTYPAASAERYTASISGESGSIAAATHGLGSTKYISATFFRDDGTDNVKTDIPYLVTDTGTVTWTSSESITGFILLVGRG